jgi:outer membrane protein TolC
MKQYFIFSLVMAALCLALGGVALAEEDETPTDYEIVVKANADSDSDYEKLKEKLLARYTSFLETMTSMEKSSSNIFTGTDNGGLSIATGSIPAGYTPWWEEQVRKPITHGTSTVLVDSTSLFERALANSSQIKVFSDLPLIRETGIQEADGEFDFRLFTQGNYNSLNEPVGDDLTTGGPLRYKEDSTGIEYGLKKKFSPGTEVELKQSISGKDTNSIYFNPIDQAWSGTYLTIRQPLLKGFGIAYNTTALHLAEIDHLVAGEELRRNVESHLLEISRAYWGLYLERSLLAQKYKLVNKTADIYKQMQERISIDVQPSLLARARSMQSSYEMEALQAGYGVLNAQSRLRALINDPELLNAAGLELVTNQQPSYELFDIPFDTILQTALDNRPEVAQSVKHIQAAYLRLEQSSNELMPNLDLFFQTYVKGLEGDYEYGTAYSNQFDDGSPSYVGGLRLEFPLGNNQAQARNKRKRLEIRQLLHQLDTTVENVLLEAQVSYRELIKNYRSIVQSYQIMHADEEEINSLISRIELLLSQNEPYGDMLYRLMDASERLSKSEELLAKSELTYNYSLYNLYRSMGILVSKNNIVFSEEKSDDKDKLPIMHIERQQQ